MPIWGIEVQDLNSWKEMSEYRVSRVVYKAVVYSRLIISIQMLIALVSNNKIAPIAYIYNNMQSVTISHWNSFTWVDLKFTIKWLYFDLLYIHNQLILRCLFYNNVLTVLECDDALVYCPFLRILSRGYML